MGRRGPGGALRLTSRSASAYVLVTVWTCSLGKGVKEIRDLSSLHGSRAVIYALGPVPVGPVYVHQAHHSHRGPWLFSKDQRQPISLSSSDRKRLFGKVNIVFS
jgi:hypothetical protein